MRYLIPLSFAVVAASGPAVAGDEVLYEDLPSWVVEADLESVLDESGPAELLRDWQYRIEGGVEHAFADRAVRIDNPQSLMNENTLSWAWLPDKGDLTVHKLEIYRDGERIDLLEQGVKFEVIRREQGLERRLLDGQLTATLSVPGLRENDVLRTAFTVSNADQALGDEVQTVQFLPSDPWQVGQSRVIVSWPAAEDMHWRVEESVALDAPIEREGYKFLEVDLPLAERDPVPQDAPWRFRRPAVLRVGTFASWEEISQAMVPHFETAAQLKSGSPIVAQAARIMSETDSPLERAALATRLVQDEVSYLLNGLNGGNYLPQSADETWDKRYGDCKAKSVLLLSLLREMGIDSEVVLVSTRGGDAVPELLPQPAAFDHMIVHAVIDGTDYWLDGTSSATRLSNVGDVPAFYHALPLRSGGAGLMPMTQRDLAAPQVSMAMELDHSAGVDLPTLFTIDVLMAGRAGAGMRQVVDADNPEVMRQLARRFSSGDMEGAEVSAISVEYDEELAEARMRIDGVASSEFEWQDGRLSMMAESGATVGNFNPDRARSAWRNIPVATRGPVRQAFELSVELPHNGRGFTLSGETDLDVSYANTRVRRKASLDAGTLSVKAEVFETLGEVPASDLPQAKRESRRLSNDSLEVLSPRDATWRWERSAAERKQIAEPIIAAYNQAIEFADEDEFGPLQSRGLFYMHIYDYENALRDFDELIQSSPSAWAYWQRSSIQEMLGNDSAAIDDLQASFDLEPNNSAGFELARLLAYGNRVDEAAALLDSLPVGEDERAAYADIAATVAALQGNPQTGLELLDWEIADKPHNASILNSDCWFRGLFKIALEDALQNCTRAVERAENEAPALDSRALVQYRLGNLDGALSDLNTALEVLPGLAASLYLRGLIRIEQGNREGRDDIEKALNISPNLAEFYARHGLAPAD